MSSAGPSRRLTETPKRGAGDAGFAAPVVSWAATDPVSKLDLQVETRSPTRATSETSCRVCLRKRPPCRHSVVFSGLRTSVGPFVIFGLRSAVRSSGPSVPNAIDWRTYQH
jgi:hypothetical protein